MVFEEELHAKLQSEFATGRDQMSIKRRLVRMVQGLFLKRPGAPLAMQLAWRMSFGRGQFWSVPTLVSLTGLALGVGCLVAAMGVVSGFESTLKQAITDVVGDVVLVRRTMRAPSRIDIIELARKRAPEIMAATPFVNLEAVIAGSGRSSGVLLQGLDAKTVDSVLRLKKRVVSGTFDISKADDIPNAVVGKRLAKNYNLKMGETFRVIVPIPDKYDSAKFNPMVQKFRLKGTMDMGKVDYDDRAILTDLTVVQKLAGLGENVSGWRLRLDDSRKAFETALKLSAMEGFWTMTWADVNANLFEAIKIEKPVIFFVVLVMVIAAAFNVSTQLFVSVVAKYSDVSILRALGLSKTNVKRLFVWQGVLMGSLGVVLGLFLGLVFLILFEFAQTFMVILPAETYKIDHIKIDVRALDVIATAVATIAICWLATLIPAARASKLDPVEGLRYE